jgi:hypothetical protein
MDEVKLIKKSQWCKDQVNQMRLNLVKADIEVIFFRNQELIVKTPNLSQAQKGLAEAIQKQRVAVNLLRAAEQELEVCLKEEAEEQKKKN